MQLVSTIATRYSSTVIQFVVALIVARVLPPAELGTYLTLFGVVTAGCFAVGLGVPDGFVKSYPVLLAKGRESEAASLLGSLILSGSILSITMAVPFAAVVGVTTGDLRLGLIAAVWWLAYAAMYVGSQGMVGIGRGDLGAFMYYGSINWATLLSLAAYLVAFPTRTLLGLMTAVATGGLVAGLVVVVLLLRSAPVSLGTWWPASVMRLGVPIASVRIMQTALIWSPVWCTAALLGTSWAATIGIATRLTMAAGAATAALRFSARAQIVTLASTGDWSGIQALGRRIAGVCTAICVFAFVLDIAVGWKVLPLIFGRNYTELHLAVAVLMIGVVVEAMSGVCDELLKMTDGARFVTKTLITTVAIASIVEVSAGVFGNPWLLLAGYAVCFAGMYVAIVRQAFVRYGVVPALFPSSLVEALSRGRPKVA